MTHIFVISHKPLPAKLETPFMPLYVGAEAAKAPQNDLCDSRGDSISEMNPYFCELTGLYWVWKNWLPTVKADELIGFCHYRRFFSPIKKIEKFGEIKDGGIDGLECLLLDASIDVILPEQTSFPIKQHWFSLSKRLNKVKFPWQKLSLIEQYGLEHNLSDILLAADLLPQPHRLNFQKYLEGEQFSPFNMFITSSDSAKNYFELLFPWMFEVQKKIDLTSRTSYQSRVFGFIAERFCSYYFNTLHKPKFVPVSFIKE
jgi:Domain of unknown function (DUF4422)